MAATILEFPEMQAPPRVRKTQRGRTSAEIVLFPGVRYERRADEQPQHERPRVERDRLQLIE
jgi:hypothetical protein